MCCRVKVCCDGQLTAHYHPQTVSIRAYNRSMNSNELKALNFSMTLQDRCLTLADALADEINGELGLVPDEDVERILAGLTESNLNETAEELAQLAAWFN